MNIKFTSYPYMEFGIVKGVVGQISMVSSENNYVVEVTLPQGLRTSFGKNLMFSQEMQGTAEIITDDVSLLARIFSADQICFGYLCP